MSIEGVSDRPYPEDHTDLLSYDYVDPLEIKDERAALAGILSVRGYQNAKETLLGLRDKLSEPRLEYFGNLPLPSQHMLLQSKAVNIGRTFTRAMLLGLVRDEGILESNPDHPATQVFNRLNQILSPFEKDIRMGLEYKSPTGETITPSSAVHDVYGGVESLPTNIIALLKCAEFFHKDQTGETPDMATTLKIVRDSYTSWILPMASMHRAEGAILDSGLRGVAPTERNRDMAEFHEGKIWINKSKRDKIANFRKNEGKDISKRSMCAFLADTTDMEPFLDRPADFKDPLKDAFNLCVDLLAA